MLASPPRGRKLNRTGLGPNRGWPACDIMYPNGNPTSIAQDPILVTKIFRDLSPKHGWVFGAPLEPLATALNIAGAMRVDAQALRTLDASFEI